MKHLIFIAFIVFSQTNIILAQDQVSDDSESLFERLGGVEGITLIVDDVIEAHMINPVIKDIFTPLKAHPERLEKIRQHTIEFFSAGSGGPVVYKGRKMTLTHEGMDISAEEYMCVMDDIMNVLEEHGIDETSKKDVLAILWSLKEMIMGK
jgi:hemoglobin|tara:strand:- start:3251 stop:3703 length:453 start_codon:yes stop_codon:yes gene_type:complete